ncbi:hypothetical protein F511_39354 [Dorcoceras hygrometricum]|uniref:Uncharacterized protein n=1 Tax=Dorcoceras hygrometricum TaxID=472368 RepID=A0A2Z7B172_9LAMI|nr:hypothetical protein F511_39354 [Dorcoceras hygrometricum]
MDVSLFYSFGLSMSDYACCCLGQSHDQQRNLGNLKKHTGNNTQAPEDIGVKPQYGEQYKQHKESNRLICKCYARDQGYKQNREPKDRDKSSTARSDQRKDRQCPRGILSTWELPTHLQYTVTDAKQTAPPAVAHS